MPGKNTVPSAAAETCTAELITAIPGARTPSHLDPKDLT
jgi:hypothetical protein